MPPKCKKEVSTTSQRGRRPRAMDVHEDSGDERTDSDNDGEDEIAGAPARITEMIGARSL